MNDQELKEKWSKITDPTEAIQELLKHQDFLGYDSYYSDLREGLLDMLSKTTQNFECRHCSGTPDAPMMKDDIWSVVSSFYPNHTSRDLLCITCVEIALGRRIQLKDLKDVPANAFTFHYEKKLKNRMVQRFLGWQLPEDFTPDGGISFEPLGNKGTTHEYRRLPSGTNLLNFTQAQAMIEYITDDQ